MATPDHSNLPKKPSYSLYKPLPNGLFLVRRITDGEVFLAHPLDAAPSNDDRDEATTTTTTEELIRRGAARAAANLLNHENLVSIHDELVDLPLRGGGNGSEGATQRKRRMLLWDWCDAGTLQDVFDAYTPAFPATEGGDVGGGGDGGGFLPEGFIWHVGLGLLRALQWLHEGVRDVYAVAEAEGGNGRRCRRVRGKAAAEGADWMPVLHRDVRAENVFLQRPRGIETYGAVKLGNFERCFVSGSVGARRETPVVAMQAEDVSLDALRERVARWKRDGLALDESQRPYTQGSELFAVGAMLYRMMCGRPLPAPEECPRCRCFHLTSNDAAEQVPCPHACVGDVNIDEVFKPLTNYTDDLKDLVSLLLRLHRSDEWWASSVLDIAWGGYENWAATTEDGMLHRDIFDDMWFRRQNQARMGGRQQEMDEEEDAMELDGGASVLVV